MSESGYGFAEKTATSRLLVYWEVSDVREARCQRQVALAGMLRRWRWSCGIYGTTLRAAERAVKVKVKMHKLSQN